MSSSNFRYGNHCQEKQSLFSFCLYCYKNRKICFDWEKNAGDHEKCFTTKIENHHHANHKENTFLFFYISHQNLSSYFVAFFGRTLSLSTKLFALWHRGYQETWTFQGRLACIKKNIILQPLGRKRLWPCPVMSVSGGKSLAFRRRL